MMNLNLEYFFKNDLNGVILKDAGSANHIIYLLKNKNLKNFVVYAQDPARKIWIKNFGYNNLTNNSEDLITNCNLVLYGTGFPGKEFQILKKLKKKCIPIIALIDHWTNYKERFLVNGRYIFPNTIWVLDDKAFKKAKITFNKKVPIIEIPNYFLNQTIKLIANENEKKGNFLYLSEPLKEKWNKSNSCNEDAIKFCLDKVSNGYFGKINSFLIKPHPTQSKRYFNWINDCNFSFKVIIDSKVELSKAIGKAEFVAGCETYALIIAYKANKKTFFSLPPWAPNSKLPYEEIKYIRDMTIY